VGVAAGWAGAGVSFARLLAAWLTDADDGGSWGEVGACVEAEAPCWSCVAGWFDLGAGVVEAGLVARSFVLRPSAAPCGGAWVVRRALAWGCVDWTLGFRAAGWPYVPSTGAALASGA
jgi:hypothetical protein